MSFLDFISNPYFQAVLTCITILLAFITCCLTFSLSRPKIKVKVIKNKSGKHDCSYRTRKETRTGVVHLNIENNSQNQTQIKDICFSYKGKRYHVANIYTDYSNLNHAPHVTLNDKKIISEDYFLGKIPFSLNSFESKQQYFSFYEFPKIEKKSFLRILEIYVVGKKAPILKPVWFEKSEFTMVLPFEYVQKNKHCVSVLRSNIPIRNKHGKIVSKKTKP